VAVKVLHPHPAGLSESRARLQREAHAVAKLRHENILEIFDYSGPESNDSYIVTEFIHGQTLKQFLAKHPLPFPEVAEMMASEVARALEHAHGLGVIHRDIKPENVMIRDDGMLKLMDFGIAQIVDKERMTVTGQLLGSPAYMAPEHVEGGQLDFRTDVFAVGILLYQLATGQLPFSGKNPHEVLKRIAECKYRPPEMVNPKIGARLARVIKKALMRDPNARYPDVAPMRKELVEDLEDAGVEDARKELSAFLAKPDEWTAAFKPRLVAALSKTGQTRKRKGRTAAALELWGRALALDPDSRELKALVDGVELRRRVVQVAAFVGVAVIAAGGITWYALRAKPEIPPPPVVPLVVPKKVEVAPQPPVEPPQPPVEPPQPIAKKVTPKIVPKSVAPTAPAATRNVELVPIPKAVRVFLDGKDLGDHDPTRTYAMDDQPHTFRLESPYCRPLSVPIAAGQTKVSARLLWKPAMLTINATPPSADVQVAGGPLVQSGQPIQIDIPAQSESGKHSVTVTVSAAGHTRKDLTLHVRAGEAKNESVVLDAKGNE
jgi:serine/threonine-protein kinase